VKEIIELNGLDKTGIVFIWDEFTKYLRNENIEDDYLREISEFCKQSPLYMFFVVHEEPSLNEKLGSGNFERIQQRYHRVTFQITEEATYELIGRTIEPHIGKENDWEDTKSNIMMRMRKYLPHFEGINIAQDNSKRIKMLLPFHPFTLNILARVAGTLSGSQRTLFKFMKDSTQADKNVGFIYFIETADAEELDLLTVDYLWDYFFNSDKLKSYPQSAVDAYRNYLEMKDRISDSDSRIMRVFKAAMLLMAFVSDTAVTNLKSRAARRTMSATKGTLNKCFYGLIDDVQFNQYIDTLEEIGVLRIDKRSGTDPRIELPFSGAAGNLEEDELKRLKQDFSRYQLFTKDGEFAKSIREKMWDSNSATFRRVSVSSCSTDTNSFKMSMAQLKDELTKSPYKIGVCVISFSEENQYANTIALLKSLINNAEYSHYKDALERIVFAVLKTPFKDSELENWQRSKAKENLARREGKGGNGDRFRDDANEIKETWASQAVVKGISFVYNGEVKDTTDNYDFQNKTEKSVLYFVYPNAIEQIIPTHTAYKSNQKAAVAGANHESGDSSDVKCVPNRLNELKLFGKC